MLQGDHKRKGRYKARVQRPTQAPVVYRRMGRPLKKPMYADTRGRARFDPTGNCAFCMTAKGEVYSSDCILPFHEPSSECRQGKVPHCACDICF
jgi:hypothetical protein